MATLRIDDFKSALRGGGARPNYFQVTPSWPAGAPITNAGELTRLGSFLIKSASMPNSTTGEIAVPFRGRKLYVAGDREFEPWSISIVNDTDFALRNAFEVWLNYINAHVGGQSAAPDLNSYIADWKIDQLDKAGGAVIKTYVMRGAFPVSMDGIDVSFDAQDEIETFNVTLRYQYWTSDTTDQVGGALPA